MIAILATLVLMNILPVLSYLFVNSPKLSPLAKNRDLFYFLMLILSTFILYCLIEIKLLVLIVIIVMISWFIVTDYYFTSVEKFSNEMAKALDVLDEQLSTVRTRYDEVALQYNNVTNELNKYVNLFSLVQEINQNVELQKIGSEFYKKLVSYFPGKINFVGILVAKKKDVISTICFSPCDELMKDKISSLWHRDHQLSDKTTEGVLQYRIYRNQYEYILLITHTLTQDEISHLEFFVEETKIGFIRSILFKEVEELSRKDGLTGLYLRRYFLTRLNDELSRAVRYNYKFSVIMFDIDFFKKVNDTYGHIAGDNVLKEVARIINDVVGAQGLCSRWGGEEFLVFIPHQTKQEVFALAENIRKSIEEYNFYFNAQNIKITISGGISSYPEDSTEIKNLIEVADQKLYKAKQSGRNKIVV